MVLFLIAVPIVIGVQAAAVAASNARKKRSAKKRAAKAATSSSEGDLQMSLSNLSSMSLTDREAPNDEPLPVYSPPLEKSKSKVRLPKFRDYTHVGA